MGEDIILLRWNVDNNYEIFRKNLKGEMVGGHRVPKAAKLLHEILHTPDQPIDAFVTMKVDGMGITLTALPIGSPQYEYMDKYINPTSFKLAHKIVTICKANGFPLMFLSTKNMLLTEVTNSQIGSALTRKHKFTEEEFDEALAQFLTKCMTIIKPEMHTTLVFEFTEYNKHVVKYRGYNAYFLGAKYGEDPFVPHYNIEQSHFVEPIAIRVVNTSHLVELCDLVEKYDEDAMSETDILSTFSVYQKDYFTKHSDLGDRHFHPEGFILHIKFPLEWTNYKLKSRKYLDA